jgi:uncharacterized protein YycO
VAVHRTIYCRSRVGTVVRFFDGMGHWSHCAGILSDGEHVVEALGGPGVVITPLEDVIRRSTAFEIVERPVTDPAAGDAWALSTVGSGYDWLGAIGSPWRRPWEAPGRWYCSEHDYAWEMKSGGRPRFRADKRGVTPNESYWAL